MDTCVEPGILCIQTGGTIDKAYPRTIGGYAFEICGPAVEKILTRIKPSVKYRVITICQKDSQDITDSDRKNLVEACQEAQETKILVTHGTDTMIQTAEFLARHLSNKVVVLTGAFLPETFKESDADFNIGTGIGALQTLQRNGIYIAMNGCVSVWDKCRRDEVTNMFTGGL